MGVGSSNGSWATSNNHTNKKNNDNKLTALMQIFSKREWQMEKNDWKNVMCDHKRSLGLCKKLNLDHVPVIHLGEKISTITAKMCILPYHIGERYSY